MLVYYPFVKHVDGAKQRMIQCAHNDFILKAGSAAAELFHKFTITLVNRLDRCLRRLLAYSEESKQRVQFLVGILFEPRNVNKSCGTKLCKVRQHWI